MEKVSIEFYNIQSHEHTRFSLKPGLNFILADDNNVGKTTIFSVLATVVKLPAITPVELQGLLRSGTMQGYASFIYGTNRTVLWLNKDESGRVSAFFEASQCDELGIYVNPIRSLDAPKHLLSALDLVRGPDGEAMNINSADSVQLIVVDSPQNDKIISTVLVDLDIERIKQNSESLTKQIAQDARIISSQETDSAKILTTVKYNEMVDQFFQMEESLYKVASVVDILDTCVLTEDGATSSTALNNLDRLDKIFDVLSALDSVHVLAPGISEESKKSLERLDKLYVALSSLSDIDFTSLDKSYVPTSEIDRLECLYSVLSQLNMILNHLASSRTWDFKMRKGQGDAIRTEKQLSKVAKVVKCPVQGRVYYDGQGCVPASDGLAH